jgi:hypothetical protein
MTDVKAEELKVGGEIDYGVYTKVIDGKRTGFRLSLRWNQEKERFEVFRYVFRDKSEHVVSSSAKLTTIVAAANRIANSLCGKQVYRDVPKEG